MHYIQQTPQGKQIPQVTIQSVNTLLLQISIWSSGSEEGLYANHEITMGLNWSFFLVNK